MKNVKMSLVDNDFAVQCQADVHLDDRDGACLMDFLREVREDLSIGQTACLEFEDLQGDPISITVSFDEYHDSASI